MHKLKYLVLALAMALLGLGVLNTSVYAADMGSACEDTGFDDPLLCGTPGANEEAVVQQKVANVLNQVYLWIGIIAVVVIVISGIRYMTSQGNAESIKKAKAGILYATIGLVVVLAAFAITLVITNAIQGNQVNTAGASDTSGGGSGEGAGGTPGGGSSGSTPEVVDVEYIRTRPTSIRIEEGSFAKITTGIVPDYATDRTITYSSSDTSIATVDSSSGIIEGKKEGTVTITAKSNNNKTATTTVEVFKIVEADSVSVAPATAEIKKGKTQKLTATVKPDDTKDKSVTWSSSDSSIATVSSDGTVTGKKVGTATITAKTKNNKTGTATITVTEESSIATPGADRHTIGNKALAVMHAANNGDINKVIKAGEKKYYAVECDVIMSGNTIYCAHDDGYFNSSSPTLDRTFQEAKKYGMVVILDHVSGDTRINAVANYIKKNNLYEQSIVQLYDYGGTVINTMKTMNSIAGKKLHYIGCHMSGMSTSGYSSKGSEMKSLGLTAVNVQMGEDSAMQAIKNAGFDLSVFTWVYFSEANITKYNSAPYNAKYMMTNDVDKN